jgi:energy-coupling factor transport system ATP-binding protein
VSGPVLELEAVSYRYPGASRPALADVTLTVGEGELLVLAGRSGSGKSTLLGVASGLVPHFHGGTFSGRAKVIGMDVRQHGPADLAAGVGTLFQDPETQVVMGSVRGELALPLENRGLPAGAVARGVEEAALALGIVHLLDRPTSELSGGELQRAALGASIAGRPSLIVLDEPTSQLDPVAGDELIGLLKRLNDDFGVSILLAEHRLERCLALADRVVALDGGRVICDAGPEGFAGWAVESAPELATPGSRLLAGVDAPVRVGVKAARAALSEQGIRPRRLEPTSPPARLATRPAAGEVVLRFERVWHELREGSSILRDVSLSIARGERVALMGANGAGKSTLLRHAAGLMSPSRGRVRTEGRIALLLQNPTDYLVHETVAQEAPPGALRSVDLDPGEFGPRHPRDLSVGEKQRLALAVVLGDPQGQPPAVLCLDEPTRGMDRHRKAQLAEFLSRQPYAVVVATHDPEFVAEFADRVVLLGGGAVVADASAPEILAGGTYFATETARILGGAGGALTPAQGVALLLDTAPAEALV